MENSRDSNLDFCTSSTSMKKTAVVTFASTVKAPLAS